MAEMLRNSVGAANCARLTALKAKYDPTNLFRMNLNITPRARGKIVRLRQIHDTALLLGTQFVATDAHELAPGVKADNAALSHG